MRLCYILLLVVGAAASGRGAAAPSPGAVLRLELERIVEPDIVAGKGRGEAFPGRPAVIRGDRALRCLERLERVSERRDASLWFAERYHESLTHDYYNAACQATLYLGEAALGAPLRDRERRVLAHFSKEVGGSLPHLAKAALLEDQLRGQAREARDEVWLPNLATGLGGYLLLHEYRVPPRLQGFWETGNRWETYRKRAYEGSAGEHYFRFKAMRFATIQAEMEFLWDRILAQYERSSKPGVGPDDLELYQFEEARAATARLIEIGDQVVPFLLAKREFILQAADPSGPRARVGDIYELWVAAATLHPGYKPLAQKLAACGQRKVERRARDVLNRMLADDPYPYRALFVYQFRTPVGG
jgi:hypothetical protein